MGDKERRDFFNSEIPQGHREVLCKHYDIELKAGCTYMDALKVSLLKRAKEGDTEAIEFAKKYNIHE